MTRYDDFLSPIVHDEDEDVFLKFCDENGLDPDSKRALVIWNEQEEREIENSEWIEADYKYLQMKNGDFEGRD